MTTNPTPSTAPWPSAPSSPPSRRGRRAERAPFDAPEPGDAAALLSLLDELAARGRAIRQQAAAARPESAAEREGGDQ